MDLFQQIKKKPLVMGILNVTPDSFFDGGKYIDETTILTRTEQILNEGADIIDIGGYSSRPSAEDVSEEEEISRLSPAIELILNRFPNVIFSVDTFRANVAKKMVNDYNVSIINDISGGTLDKNMFATIATLNNAYYVLTHMRGTPKTMLQQENVTYNNVTESVFQFFRQKIEELNMLCFNKIILDPGFGFAKTTEQNYELLKNLSKFCTFEKPILAGVSRKTMLWKTLDCEPNDCLNATTVANTIALINGANILRVHDVKEAVECVKIVDKLTSKQVDKF